MTITLKGMTWSHPRGYLPLEAASRRFRAETGVAIEWDRRSLQDFESYPVEDLARRYDLIIIDHPHVGQITAENCLLPLDDAAHGAEIAAIAAGTVGPSFESYRYQGRLWALPVDAATQVQAYRIDRLDGPVEDFDAVKWLADRGLALMPMRPPHSLMCVFTLAAHLGTPAHLSGDVFLERQAGLHVLDLLAGLTAGMDPRIDSMDPIAALDLVGRGGTEAYLVPLTYGYVNYALEGFRPHRIAFADMAVIDGRPPLGSAVGGTGLAVSAFSQHPDHASHFCRFVAGGAIQADLYPLSGGQAGHAAGWEAEEANRQTLDFYRATRRTIEGGYLRPRFNGYMGFQEKAAHIVTEGLREGRNHGAMLDAFDAAFRAAQSRA